MISWNGIMRKLVVRFWWIWIVVAVLFGVVSLRINPWTPASKPLVFQSDIGTFVPFRATERPIMIENPGRRVITIKEVNLCCGISLPYGFPKTIRPQSTAAMVVHIRGFDSPLEHTITLKTDDPAHPITECVIRGKPDSLVPYTPGKIMFGKVVAGQTLPSIWKIFKGNGPDLTCNAVSSSPYITVLVREADKVGNVEIGVLVSKDAPRGKLVGYLFATTGVRARPTLSTRFEGEVERGLRARPENVFFGVVKDEAVVSRRIDLEVLEPGWDTVKVDRPSEECLETQVARAGPSKYELRVWLNPEKMPKILETVLKLRDSSGDSIQIPVIAVQRTSVRPKAVAVKQAP